MKTKASEEMILNLFKWDNGITKKLIIFLKCVNTYIFYEYD